MKFQTATKGYFFAFLAVLAMSNVYIFSKAALSEASLPVFGFYWFLFFFLGFISTLLCLFIDPLDFFSSSGI